MTLVVEFIDTSVLAEILRIPGKSQCHEIVVARLAEQAEAGTRFILPTATVIETGNHVFQVKDGGARRVCATKFVELLRLTASGTAPWAFHRRTWSEDLLDRVCEGGSTGMDLVEHATRRQLGAGDLSIVAERDLFAAQNRGSGLMVRIWTLEACMKTWAAIPPPRSGGSESRTRRV